MGDLERGGKEDNLSLMTIFMAAMLDSLQKVKEGGYS